MLIAGVAPPELTTGAVPVTEVTVPDPLLLKVVQSVADKYPSTDVVACGIEIAGAAPPLLTTGAVPVTPVTVPEPLLLKIVQSAALNAPRLVADAVGTFNVITGVVVGFATVELRSVPVVPSVSAETDVTVPPPMAGATVAVVIRPFESTVTTGISVDDPYVAGATAVSAIEITGLPPAPVPLATLISVAVPVICRGLSAPDPSNAIKPAPDALAKFKTRPVKDSVGLPKTPLPFVIERPLPLVKIVRAITDAAPSFTTMPVRAVSRLPDAALSVRR